EVYSSGAYVFTGAGNDEHDTANCDAYNALCVGGYDMNGSPGHYTDDPLWGGSYLNPSSGREYPELVGPAAGTFARASGSGYVAGAGTSFSTPAVAGLAGLLVTTYPL